jgi:S-adenosylmethionine synthetase
MNMKIFTSEAVTSGHPDKICDIIADTILDACIEQDVDSKVSCEVCCTTGTIILMGDITTHAVVDYRAVARGVLKGLGYTDSKFGISHDTCAVIDMINRHTPEVKMDNLIVVDSHFEDPEIEDAYDKQGADDQGIVFGYACSETSELMPLSHMLAHNLARRLEECREENEITWLRPDGKVQVSIAYKNDGTVSHIDTLSISAQHDEVVDHDTIYEEIMSRVILVVLRDMGLLQLFMIGPNASEETKILINPDGVFSVGGPQRSTGLTGRKLVADTYGGNALIGGGALSGKSAHNIDRAGAYMARYIAKHIVASGIALKSTVQIAYAKGESLPVSLTVDTLGTGLIPDDVLSQYVKSIFDVRPLAIINHLDLKAPIYSTVAPGCQFGNYEYSWEVLSKFYIDRLKDAVDSYRASYLCAN